jgi:hypothetical protein
VIFGGVCRLTVARLKLMSGMDIRFGPGGGPLCALRTETTETLFLGGGEPAAQTRAQTVAPTMFALVRCFAILANILLLV